MTTRPPTDDTLQARNAELLRRLEEAEETLRAIQDGSVDAVVVQGSAGHRVYTLEGADRPYRLLVERMQQGAVTLHVDGSIAYCNRRAAELLGVPPETAIGTPMLEFVAPAARASLAALLRQSQDGFAQGELQLLRNDHEPVSVLLTFNLLPPDCGASIGLLITDLTAQKHHEQLRIANEALRESETTLREADQRKNQFLAMLSHELRNPLAPILHATQVLRLQASDSEDPTHRRARQVIERQTSTLAKLVNDLLDIARLTTGRIELQRGPVDLRQVVQHALETTAPLLAQLQHRVVQTMPPHAVWLHADPTRLEEVVVNLLSNAAKYTDHGGTIEVILEQDQAHGILRLRDSGVGIAAEILPHVFELFSQADRSLERTQGGLGIGLHVVQRLVELHGGSVSAYSAGLGKGSEFVVRLPLAPAPPPPRSPEPAAADTDRRGVSVLVVDDNADSCAMLALFLELQGYSVQTAHSGPAALELAMAWRPQVALLDIGLPGLNGFEVARRLRERFPALAMRLVAITGYGHEEHVDQSRAVGFDRHLLKPIDPTEVDRLIQAWLGRTSAERV